MKTLELTSPSLCAQPLIETSRLSVKKAPSRSKFKLPIETPAAVVEFAPQIKHFDFVPRPSIA